MINNYSGVPAQNFSEIDFSETFSAVLRHVYVWMAFGLFVTAGVAAFVSVSPLFQIIAGQPLIFFGLLIAELALVFGLSRGINRLAPGMAVLLFLAYAALNGLTFSMFFVVYTLGSVTSTFVATAALFGVMSILGYTTNMDLSKVGSFLFMGVVGLIIAMLVNMFWANSALGLIITFAGILIFLGLTVYDTQRIKRMTFSALQQGDENVQARMGILGALSLYLDFINLFLFMLQLGGRRR
jgi:uncharacterized protein